MNDQQDEREHRDEPAAGGGMAGNPEPGEMERIAVEKVAGHPGSIANAAGMHGQGSSAGVNHSGEQRNHSTPMPVPKNDE